MFTQAQVDAAVSSALRGRDAAQNEAINLSMALAVSNAELLAEREKVKALEKQIEELKAELSKHLPQVLEVGIND